MKAKDKQLPVCADCIERAFKDVSRKASKVDRFVWFVSDNALAILAVFCLIGLLTGCNGTASTLQSANRPEHGTEAPDCGQYQNNGQSGLWSDCMLSIN